MIIDSLQNSARYEQLNPYFKQAFDFLKNLNRKTLSAGKFVLKEDTLIVNISDSKLKDKEESKLEAHNKYIDIQVPISCSESFGWKYRPACSNFTDAYNEEKDIVFYEDTPATYFSLRPEEFVIFFPEDAHAPCIGNGEIKKIVVKVLICKLP